MVADAPLAIKLGGGPNGAAIVCDTAPDVLATKFASPPYVAVIECTPTASVLVENVARFGDAPLSALVPIVVVPSLNVTVPVAAPLFTVAVNVTVVPCATES